MTHSFRFKTKLIIFAMSVAFLALTISLSFSLWSSYSRSREERLSNLRSLLNLMAYNLEAPVAFDDAEAARVSLESLRFEPSVQFARLTTQGGKVMADFRRDGVSPANMEFASDPDGKKEEQVDFRRAHLAHPVRFEGKTVGQLTLLSSLDDLIGKLAMSAFNSLAVLLVCLLVSYLVARVFQKRLSAPLNYLLTSMEQVALKKDYSRRLRVSGEDEFSDLMRRFNQMISEIEKRDSNLESQVSERTEALREALVHAQSASEAKTQFLANMSHEIRTPLNGIIGMAALLREQELAAEQEELIGLLSGSADALLAVINDVLDFSKIEQKKVELEQREFSFGEFVDSIRGMIEFQAGEKGVSYVENLSIAPDDRLVGDSTRLRQVLLNLLSNAVKFTSRGGGIIFNAWIEPLPGAKSRVAFAVSDTGVGIPEKKLAGIFDAFTQADGSTTREYGGSGLGLTISRQLVDLMGGTMEVRSTVGTGSCFLFSLPMEVRREFVNERVVAEGVELLESALQGLRILVAEDNKVNQKLAKRMLESASHSVTIANNGAEASELVESDEFDLILMDVQMPVLDGLEATARIRRMASQKSQIPILGVSAHAFQEFRDKAISIGMDGYLTKPFKKTDLLTAIQEIVRSDDS